MPPLLSIITVIKNPDDAFLKTLASIERAVGDCLVVEHWIKVWQSEDEGSLDTGDDTWKSRLPEFSRWVASADSGVFDAMNQALALAKGEFVLFLNAGDWLSASAIDAFTAACRQNPGMEYFYFDGVTVDCEDGREFLRRAPDYLSLFDFTRRTPVLHPGYVIRKNVLSDLDGFDLRYDLASDFDLMVRLVSGGYRGKRIPEIGAFMISGGLSDKNYLRARSQAVKILLLNGGGGGFGLAVIFRYLQFLVLHFVRYIGVQRIPWLQRWVHRNTGGVPAGTYSEPAA